MKRIIFLIISIISLSNLNAQTYLFQEDVDEFKEGWAVATNSGNNWNAFTYSDWAHSGTDFFAYEYNSSAAADAYLFFPALYLRAGVTYTVSFWQRVGSSSYPEKLKLTVGTDQSIASQTTVVQDFGTLTNETYTQRTATFTPSSSGIYYFAFNCYSDADEYYLIIDDIEVYSNSCEDHSCTNATVISALPYSATGLSTCENCNNYDNGDGCGSNFMSGSEYVFSYTPSTTGWVDVQLTTETVGLRNGAAVFILDNCPDASGVNCIASNGQQYPDMHGSPHVRAELQAGQTYYIVVASDTGLYKAAGCIYFDISVTNISQPDPDYRDCYGAQPICGSTWHEPNAYSGTGEYPSEINEATSCLEGEKNGAWYSFTVENSGTLTILIEADNIGDDFDFALYNVTNANCEEIFSGLAPEVACNYVQSDTSVGGTGNTGINSDSAAVNPSFVPTINVNSGEKYVLYISQWSVHSGEGYTITLGGTADYVDDTGPSMTGVITPNCGDTTIELEFSEDIACGSLGTSDFSISGPQTLNITNVSSPLCDAGATNSYNVILTVDSPIDEEGTYTITLNSGAIEDQCGHSNPNTDQVQFTIDKPDPVISGNTTVCEGSTQTYSVTNVSGHTYDWTVIGGTLLSGNGTNSIQVQWGSAVYSPGSVTVTEHDPNTNCETTEIVQINIVPEPTADAGNDETICEDGTFSIDATATDYSSLEWSTSGDGTFSDATVEDPVYTPGPNDIANGSVTLTLTAHANSPCGTDATDNVTLYIEPAPTANAGPDDSVCENGSYTLNGSASNYSSVSWSTSGDGSFDNTSSLNATYTPGSSDIANGSVTLTLTANPNSPCSSPATDNIVLTIVPLPTVTAGSGGTICEDGTFSLDATANNYSSLQWTTSGDGSFNDATIEDPVYTPGTNDIANGSVTLTITANANSPCTNSASSSVVINITHNPTADAGADATICENGTYTLQGSATDYASVTWTTSGTGSFDNPNVLNPVYTPSASDIANGSVTLTLTAEAQSPCGTPASDNMTLYIEPAPVVDAGENDTICSNYQFVTSATASNYSSVHWTTNGTGSFDNPDILNAVYTPSAADIATGSVTLTLTAQPNTPCSNSVSDNVTLTIIPQPEVNAGNDTSLCGLNGIYLSGSASNYTSVQWTTNGNGTLTGETTLTPHYTPASSDIGTTVMFVLSAVNGTVCSAVTDTVYATFYETPSATVSTQDVTSCVNPNGQITVNASGGESPYTYSIDAGVNYYSNNTFDNLTAGSYTVVVMDNHYCTDTVNNVTVNNTTGPNIDSVVVSDLQCYNDGTGEINIYASGSNLQYSIDSGQTFVTTSDFSNLSAGVYYIQVIDGGSCIATSTVQVTEPAELTETITHTDNNCYGQCNASASVNVNGGTLPYTYLWNNGQTSSSIDNLCNGNYFVTVTDAHGCTVVDSFEVTSPTELTLQYDIEQANCYGEDNHIVAMVSGGMQPYTYLWSNGSTDSAIYNISSGTYNVTVVDANGCTIIGDSVDIYVPSQLYVNINGTQVNCSGSCDATLNATVTGGTAPYTLLWNTGATSDSLSGMCEGTYSVTVTDANGCTAIDSFEVTAPNPIMVTVHIYNPLCYGENGYITLDVLGGTQPYTYSWNTGASQDSISVTESGTYSVTITDANGCFVVEDSINITIPSQLQIQVSAQNNPNCNGSSDGAIAITVSGGTEPYTYAWNNGNTSPENSNLPAGIYSVTVSDANGCTGTLDSIILVEPEAISIATDSVVMPRCSGSSNGAIYITVSGGTPDYSFAWSNGETTEDITGLYAGNYSVTVTDANNCEGYEDFELENASAELVISDSTWIGTNHLANIDITVSGGVEPYTFIWNTGETTEDLYNIENSGEYIVTVTDYEGCTGVDTINISMELFISNVLTPNGDGKNDTWKIIDIDKYEHVKIQVYSRWGDVVFSYEGTGEGYNDVSNQWDGTYNGKLLPFGEYMYIVIAGDNVYKGVVLIKE